MINIIRGIYVGRPLVSGGITFTLFAFRAVSRFIMNPVVEFFVNPYVAFIMFLTAGVIMLYPFLKGVKALIIAPLLVLGIAFFVYAYYILP